MKNIKIMFVLGGTELGGAERQAILLAKGLREKIEGCDVRFVCAGDKPGKVMELLNENKFVHYDILYGKIKSFNRLVMLIGMMSAINKFKPDILMPFTDLANVSIALIMPLIRKNICIWNQRTQWSSFSQKTAWLITKSKIKNFDRFIANSQGGAGVLMELYKVPQEKISVIYNGVVMEEPAVPRNEWRAAHGFNDNVFLFCMVANLTLAKDHETLIKAWAELNKKTKQEICLLLAGRDDNRKAYLENLAKSLKINNIVFLGKVDDVNSMLYAVDAFVFSSNCEGTPNGVLEAMAAGLAGVATDIPNIRYTIGSNNEDFYYPCGDYKILADKMLKLLEMPSAQRKEFGEQNKWRICENFSLDKMTNLFFDEFEKLARKTY